MLRVILRYAKDGRLASWFVKTRCFLSSGVFLLAKTNKESSHKSVTFTKMGWFFLSSPCLFKEISEFGRNAPSLQTGLRIGRFFGLVCLGGHQLFSGCRERGVGKRGGGGTSWRFWRFAVNFYLKSLGSVLIILGCFGGCERFFFNDKFPHSSSAPPKHDCH